MVREVDGHWENRIVNIFGVEVVAWEEKDGDKNMDTDRFLA